MKDGFYLVAVSQATTIIKLIVISTGTISWMALGSPLITLTTPWPIPAARPTN